MLIISYDITDNKLRTKFSRMLEQNGGIRIQYSVFEVNQPSKYINIIKIKIKSEFETKFSGTDSIFMFYTDSDKCEKFGSAVYCDQELVFL